MSFNYHSIFKFPEKSKIDKKIPKVFFLRNFELTASEKKTLNSKVKSIFMLASLKKTNANIAILKDKNYIFEEIQIIVCSLEVADFENDKSKCIEIIQKYIPYPILLIIESENEFVLNVSNKRRNLNDNNKLIIENEYTTPNISKLYKKDIVNLFWKALDFKTLDKTNMQTTYAAYQKAIIQFKTASLTGNFNERSKIRTGQDILNIEKIETFELEIISLKSRIKKENNFSNTVNLNVEVQNLRKQIQQIKEELK